MANNQTTTITIPQQYQTVDKYDKQRGQLEGVALFAKPSTIRNITDVVGNAEMITVETGKMPHGHYVFLDSSDMDGHVRVVLPPKVVATIIRQCESLDRQSRSAKARENMRQRMAAGENPAAHLLAFRKKRTKMVNSQKAEQEA